jgi:hypothetical protein
MLVARYRPTVTLLSAGAAILITGGFDASGLAPKTAETYQVATRTFGAATVALQCAHEGHTATVLQNGQVLIAGRDGKTPCAELYDPVSGTFARTGNMLVNLSNHAAVLLQGGKVLIVGGTVDASGCTLCASTKSAELYDPATGTFAATTHTMAEARSSPTATLLASGQVLITGGGATPGGRPSKTAELYDPGADTFTLLTSSMSVERQFHTATVLPGGDVLVAGGLTTVGTTATATASADLYDPTTQTFRTTGPMVSPRLYHTATVLGNLVLIAGGTTQLSTGVGDGSAELYDSTTGVFTLTGNLATGRYGAGAAPLQ